MIRVLSGIWFCFWGHIFAFIFYDKKYLRGRWFAGKLNGLCAPGWKWTVQDAWQRIIFHKNRDIPFPVSGQSHIYNPENIIFDPDDLNNFQGYGIYFQAVGRIEIGKGTYIAPNVGIITSNHDVYNLDEHMPPKDVKIGENCWIGMNSVILPGVSLGERTIVGAGTVVTKSFVEGYQVIAGNPARVIRKIDNVSG